MKSKSNFSCIVCVLVGVLAVVMWARAEALPPATSVRLAGVDAVIEKAIADGSIPGAVLVVGHDGAVVYRKAYGHRALEPKPSR